MNVSSNTPERPPEPVPEYPPDQPLPPMKVRVVKAIQGVFDPELPVNIYDLGLIYDVLIDEQNNVTINMTLTSPGCPVAGTLPGDVQRQVMKVQGVGEVKVNLVWEPPWSKDRMSEAAMLELGIL